MVDSNDLNAGDLASPSRPARGLVRPQGPAGPNQRGSTGSHDSRGSSQQTGSGSQEADGNGGTLPTAYELAEQIYILGKACACGIIDPVIARATSAILKDAQQIRVQQETADRAAAAAQQSAPNGVGANGAGESAGRPSPGAPRMVSATTIDAMLEVAMEHQPQLLWDLEPVLDDEQLARVAEYLTGTMGPGEPDDDRS